MRAAAIGVDIGGTRLRAASLGEHGEVLEHESTARPTGDGTQFADQAVAAVAELVERLGRDLPVGIGIASVVDDRGWLVNAPNLGVEGYPLQDHVSKAVGRDVVVVNDASAACYAEWHHGAGRDHGDVVLLTVGTGVGGGAVVGSRLLRGAHGMATEFGHVVVCDGGRRCPCGNHGCVEAYASGRAIGEVAAEWLSEGRTSTALAREPVIDGEAVTRAARDGDALALDVITEAGRWLGVGIASLVNALDPGIVLVGGGAGAAMEQWLLPAARSAAEPRILGHRRRQLPDVVPAALGDEAGVVGAGLLARDVLARP